MSDYRKSMNSDCEEATVVELCGEDNYKDNCDPVYSEELEVECGNIDTADCVAILAEKIFDCTTLQNLQFIDKEHNFTIDSYVEDDPRYCYRDGDSVCIDLTYGQLLSILFNKLHNNFYFKLLCNSLLNNIDFY